ncbi:MarR family winged helix-turn-helix transcriptional regulator [Nocardioides solisilvae]|uniref:MarR family winged helix-turn-helix transcriptional regulator n=1 Tax=Nocardioides solisilvae TaxID=1542435 RepID=UPI000D7409D7|nr:MarR family transcriptional regulator [Nocardioides solisilvae]
MDVDDQAALDAAERAADDAPWLTPAQQQEWRALVHLLATLPPALDAQLKRDAGLNFYEYQVLGVLAMADDCTRGLSELAILSAGSPSRLSHALTRLEKAGWVERRPGDFGRRMQARLTAAGQEMLDDVAPAHVREARRLVVDVLTPEQLTALAEAARAITAVTHEERPGRC